MSRAIRTEPLTAGAFAPFGDVIEAAGAPTKMINQGNCGRYDDVARLDFANEGRPGISVFEAKPYALPLTLNMVERHPLGSQAFITTGPHKWLAVVAPAGAPPKPVDLRAFVAGAGQGVNYRRGVWHHPLIALEAVSDFIVVDRGGAGDNCDEHHFAEDEEIVLAL